MQAKTQAALALTTLAAAAVAFGNPANASAANQNQPAATPPTTELCAPISKRPAEQVLNLARQEDQGAVFGKVLDKKAMQICPVPTMTYNQLRGAINGTQINYFLGGLGLGAAGGLALGSVRPSR